MLLILIFLLVGCPKKNNFQYDTIITDVPVNLDIINSVYDDFNSDLLYLGGRYNIISSTNKGSKGEHFDIVCIPINVSYHDEDDILDFNFYNTDYTPFQERELLSITNTIFEELGSYSFYDSHKKLYLFFANNEDGDSDIKMVFTDTRDWGHYDSQYHVYAPVKSNITNSASDELYPTIDQGNAKLLFCSNRDSRSFNIYELELDFETQLYEYLPISDSIPISHNTIL